MHRGLPLVVFIESVSFSSSESEFGTSVNSARLVGLHVVHSWTLGSRSNLWLSSVMLTWTSEIFSSGSLMNSYVPSTSNIISICNAVLGISEVLKYSFPSLKSCYPIK